MRRRIIIGLLLWLAGFPAISVDANQDALSRARELYLSADYEGALVVLDRLATEGHDAGPDVADYRFFCLVALDRGDEARQTIISIVEVDPFHRLSDSQASPRMLTMFQETRKALLPDVVHRIYTEAKTAFDQHDPAATSQFDRLIALLDDPDLKNAQLSDLRAVASGFRDLSKVPAAASSSASRVESAEPSAIPAPVVMVPAPVAVTPRAPEPVTTRLAAPMTGPPDTIRVTTRGSTPVFTPKAPPPPGFEPPVPMAQSMPMWSSRRRGNSSGVLEVTIDATGAVSTVALQRPIDPSFDKALLKAARGWKFKPALFNGTPVPYLKVIEIHIQPDR